LAGHDVLSVRYTALRGGAGIGYIGSFERMAYTARTLIASLVL
jgi:hypothetical protein